MSSEIRNIMTDLIVYALGTELNEMTPFRP